LEKNQRYNAHNAKYKFKADRKRRDPLFKAISAKERLDFARVLRRN
jgi:hypothetical protein